MEYTFNKPDFDYVNGALTSILSESVDSTELISSIPPTDKIRDANKAYKSKVSILFVDIRKSTDLTDELSAKKMVKVYRSFLRMAVQSIRYSDGFIRQFAGDGIMGVFQDSDDDNNKIVSSEKAVKAARTIITYLNYSLNPLMNKYLDGLNITCGVGIATGNILITKAGMRGREGDENADNECGIIWVGSTTNYASRYCSLANGNEIFIDDSTFKELKDTSDKWIKCSRYKNNKEFIGYVASLYYLDQINENDLTPIICNISDKKTENPIKDIIENTTNQTLQLVNNLKKQSEELGNKLRYLTDKEKDLCERETLLNSKESKIDSFNKSSKIDLYKKYCNILGSAHCKKNYTVEMGQEFWENILEEILTLAHYLKLSDNEIYSSNSYYLVSIYESLENYEQAYKYLCFQAKYSPWIHASTVESIVKKSYLHSELKKILGDRITAIEYGDTYTNLKECYEKLKEMGY